LILGPLERIIKNFSGTPEIKSQLELINRNSKRLKYLVEQLLDIRKVETGKLQPKLALINIVELIRKEAAHFDFAFREKDLTYSIYCKEKEIVTLADQNMLSKVIFNLFSNALKYSEEGNIGVYLKKQNHVEVKVVWEECMECEYIKIDFKDTGRGMNEEKQARIFDRFYQDPGNKGKGYGIGLSHCRDLVNAHDGSISVKSIEGIGTTFTV
jgi:signal transduction histidine kinase